MNPDPNRNPEIDHHTIRLIIGSIAILLPLLTSLFAKTQIASISASYYDDGVWTRNIFVGFLFALSAFLLAYNGKSNVEMVLSKIAAIASMGVAMFPCKCGDHKELIPNIHGASAAVMFIILAIFCYIFYQRAYAKGHTEAIRRTYIYALCGITIIAAMAIMALDSVLDSVISAKIVRLTFYGEAAGLIAFGIAWFTASRVLPIITSEAERFSPLPSTPTVTK